MENDEKENSEMLKVLCTINEGEFTSKDLQVYLKTEGVHHKLTILKSPEQMALLNMWIE